MQEEFEWDAFIYDTNELSLAATGAWIKILHKMRKSVTRGRISLPIEGYARMLGSTVDQSQRVIDELLTYGTADTVEEGTENITLINRRMFREWQAKEANRIRQLRFQQGAAEDSGPKTNASENNGNITEQPSSYSSPSSTSLDTRRKKVKKNVEEIFDYWQAVLEHPKAILTKERARLISARLVEGYGVDDLKRAVDGCKASRYHNGKNETGTIYHGIDLIFRSGSNVERFIGYLTSQAPAPVHPGQNIEPQPEHDCQSCCDLKVIMVPKPGAEFDWEMEDTPCPDCVGVEV